MIPQEPVSALNPVFRVGDQLAEMFKIHKGLNRKAATAMAIDSLARAGVDAPAVRARQFPHELSGGLNQRVLIAMAVACHPEFLLADEPTSSLDITVQAKILDLLVKLKDELDFGVLFITHDLTLIDPLCSRIVVLYSGQAVEEAPPESILRHPAHPYTESLLKCIPGNPSFTSGSIRSQVSENLDITAGCIFSTRCLYVQERCLNVRPEMRSLSPDRKTRCHFPL